MSRLFVVLAALLFAVSCQRGDTERVRPDAIRFSHGKHLRAGATCPQCHARVVDPAADTARTRNLALPAEAVCTGCHTRPEERACAYCHAEPRNPRTYLRTDRELNFSHATHVARERGGCVSCHGLRADTSTVRPFEPEIPTMAGCATRCHDADMRAMNCTKCHRSLDRYSMEDLAFVRHPAGFARRHGAQARAESNLCSQCHEPNFCARCHNPSAGAPLADLELMSVARDFVHRGDFQARHADEARLTQNTCTRCHAVETCDGCHRTSGIGGGVGPRATHPVGWLDPNSPRSHAREARRNILACASCHETDAAQVCTPCHREGGGAGNPHPPGFAAGFDRTQHSVCLVCHTHAP